MRDFAERSVEQARKAFDGFMSAAQKATDTLGESGGPATAGARDVSLKAMSYAEQNVSAAFDFARKLVNASDVHEIMQLQTEFMKSQLQVFGEQARNIGTAATNLARGTGKPDGA
jgi:phasin